MIGKSGNNAGSILVSLPPHGVSPKDFFACYSLSANDEGRLLASAREDARRYLYNALVSFLGAVADLHTQQSAWAVTKMYYTAFYVGRAALCRAKHIIFHVPKQADGAHTQYEIRIGAGERATVVSKTPSTHKLVALRFKEVGYPGFMQSLAIDDSDPLMWLMHQREYWQYRAGRFPDPDVPNILDQVEPRKLQHLLTEYAVDTRGIYLADTAHAIVSVPFRLLTWALSCESLRSPGVVDAEDIHYLQKRCCVGKQMLRAIGQHLCD